MLLMRVRRVRRDDRLTILLHQRRTLLARQFHHPPFDVFVFVVVLVVFVLTAAAPAAANAGRRNAWHHVTGDVAIWDDVFSSRRTSILVDGTTSHGGLVWTEGPVVVRRRRRREGGDGVRSDGSDDEVVLGGGDCSLLFSDTVTAKLHSYDLRSGALDEVRARSGDNPIEDDAWRAEPGSNGLAWTTMPGELFPPGTGDGGSNNNDENGILLACQHGARRIAAMDLSGINAAAAAGSVVPLATETHDGRRLNGPNDLVVRTEEERGETTSTRRYVYFTDPVYAWLNKTVGFDDLPYLDERVKSDDGPGRCGVYRFELLPAAPGTTPSPMTLVGGPVELVAEMDRPNGIGFDGEDLIVSDCCQGSHVERCTQGTSRWIIFERDDDDDDDRGSGTSWRHRDVIEDVVESSDGGCADGFVVHPYYSEADGEQRTVLIGSCSDGLCLVDLRRREVVARLWTLRERGCKVSNVAIGDGRAFLTGNCGVLVLPLRGRDRPGRPLLQTEL